MSKTIKIRNIIHVTYEIETLTNGDWVYAGSPVSEDHAYRLIRGRDIRTNRIVKIIRTVITGGKQNGK